jgi:hypothetical protein
VTLVLVELGVVLVAFIAAFGYGFAQQPVDPMVRLKARYIALSRGSPAQAEVELVDRIESLAERFPGRSQLWYLQWLVTDLERAKR